MLRTYTVRLVALTIGVEVKWVDNLLSHFALDGVTRSRQGVERQISDAGLLAIELIRALHVELRIPVVNAVMLTRQALATRGRGGQDLMLESGLRVAIPYATLEQRLRAQMMEAMESVARIPRGRPRRDASA